MTKKLKIICIIMHFFIFTLINSRTVFPAGTGSADNKKSKKFWIGNIHIKHSISQQFEITKSTKSRQSGKKKNHQLNDYLEMRVCVKDNGDLCILTEDRTFKERFTEDSFSRNIKEICPLTKEQMKHNYLYREKHFKQRVLKPGDSNETHTEYKRDLYESFDPADKNQVDVRLTIRPDGNYHLTVYHIAKIDYKFDTENKYKFVCDKKTRIVETHITTGKTGVPPKTTKLGSGEGNESTTVFKSVQPPLTKALICVADGKIEGNRISGEKTTTDKKGKKATDKTEVYVSHWDFTYADPMHFMLDCYRHAKKILEMDIKKCFDQVGLQASDCDKDELIKCIFLNVDPDPYMTEGDTIGIDFTSMKLVGIQTLSECVGSYCSVSGDEKASNELRIKLIDCLSRAFLDYLKYIEECNKYGGCDTCFQ